MNLILNTQKSLKIIILFALINSSLFISLRPQGMNLLRITIVSLLLLSVSLLIIYAIKNFKSNDFNLYFRFIVSCLLFWIFFTISRSISTNTDDMISLFGHFLMAWAWITPLAIYFGANILNWIEINNFLIKLLIVGIILTLFLVPLTGDKYTFGIVKWVLLFPILLFTYFYQSSFNKKIIIIASLVFIYLSYLNSQRVNILFISLTGFFFILEYIINNKINLYKKSIFIILSTIILSTLLFLSYDNINNSLKKNEDLKTDTRTFLFVELFKDLNETEEIIGRGALGTYYSPYFYRLAKSGSSDGDYFHRGVNEVAYLQMILKGGVIMMILYLLILIPSSFLGIFKSKNFIARMCGYYILTYLIIWSISYYPIYSSEFILLWLSAGTCMSKKARNFTNDDLIQLITKGKQNGN